MRKAEMTPSQLEERASFVQLLVAAGWDPGGWELLFEGGARLTPEAQAEYENPSYHLRLCWWAEERSMLLELLKREDDATLAFRFYPKDGEQPLVDAVIQAQDDLSPETYVDLIGTMVPLCDRVLMETSGGLIQIS